MNVVRVTLLAFVVACGSIEPIPLTNAPLNASAQFPCDRYEGTPVKARPREGRCEVPGRPSFDYTILVDVPETSIYAAGHAFVLSSADLSRPPTNPRCAPPCLTLPALGNVTGQYTVTAEVSTAVGFPLADGTSIPVRATYVPVGRDARDPFNPALPLDVLFASSRVIELARVDVAYQRSVPIGAWTRAFEPQKPFDEYFPPRIDDVQLVRGGQVTDVVDIGGATGGLDDPTGTSRDAVVTRAEGLDGWRVWLEDDATGRRISVLKTLSGTRATPRLFTTGRGTDLTELGRVNAVVAPPDGFLAVPQLRTPLIAGTGLQSLDYPTLRQPIALEGLVAAGVNGRLNGGAFLAVASRVTFASLSVIRPDGTADPLLRYQTTVSTDDRGRFATVIPPGTYDVTVEPIEGTGFASFRRQLVVDDAEPVTLTPPRRTRVRGVAMLTDGRPAASAEVLAMAEPLVENAAQPRPRPGRARTDETGAFELELDQGQYVFTVIPQSGTGFPRVVTRATVPFDESDLGVVRIPPPTRVQIQLREPSVVAIPISGARVRIFATPEAGPDGAPVPALEIGSTTTDSGGNAEILLAQRPK